MEIGVLLILVLLVRVFDGIEHGLHWNSKPSKDNGELFHTADLLQTWVIRGIYLTILYLLIGFSWSIIPFIIGISMIDQSIWQVFLNKFAGNGWFSGELNTAEFSWWPTSGKMFANELRISQFCIGLWFVSFGLMLLA